MQESFWLSLGRKSLEKGESKRIIFTVDKDAPQVVQDLIVALNCEPTFTLLEKALELRESSNNVSLEVIQEIITAIRSENWILRFFAFPIIVDEKTNKQPEITQIKENKEEISEKSLEIIAREIIVYLNFVSSFILIASQRDFSKKTALQKRCTEILEKIAADFSDFCNNIFILETFYRKVDHCAILGDFKPREEFFNLTKGIVNNLQQGIVYKNKTSDFNFHNFFCEKGLYDFFVKGVAEKVHLMLNALELGSELAYCDVLYYASQEWDKKTKNLKEPLENVVLREEERIIYLDDFARSLGNTLVISFNLSLFLNYFSGRTNLLTLKPNQRKQIKDVFENLSQSVPMFLHAVEVFSRLSSVEKSVVLIKLQHIIANTNQQIFSQIKSKKTKKQSQQFMLPQFNDCTTQNFEKKLIDSVRFNTKKIYSIFQRILSNRTKESIDLLLSFCEEKQKEDIKKTVF